MKNLKNLVRLSDQAIESLDRLLEFGHSHGNVFFADPREEWKGLEEVIQAGFLAPAELEHHFEVVAAEYA